MPRATLTNQQSLPRNHPVSGDYSSYLQLEYDKLCFKVDASGFASGFLPIEDKKHSNPLS